MYPISTPFGHRKCQIKTRKTFFRASPPQKKNEKNKTKREELFPPNPIFHEHKIFLLLKNRVWGKKFLSFGVFFCVSGA